MTDSSSANSVRVTPETTPNPASYKFVFNRQIADESAEFTTAEETDRSPLATKLFGFPWVESVFIGPNFVSVNKQDWVGWDVLIEPLRSLIQEHVADGYAVLFSEAEIKKFKEDDATERGLVFSEDDTPEIRTIKEVIEYEIRPAVSLDGGDVVFHSFKNDIVYVQMRGACSGCPSSTHTLKIGIEGRLKQAVPSIKEVVSI